MATSDDRQVCSICYLRFSRTEHLRRHLTIHTSSRPYLCQHCQRSFNRKDALNRHLVTCLSESSGSAISPLRACRRCSARKRRCGHERPGCKACQTAGEACSYSSRPGGGPSKHETLDSSHSASHSAPALSELVQSSSKSVAAKVDGTLIEEVGSADGSSASYIEKDATDMTVQHTLPIVRSEQQLATMSHQRASPVFNQGTNVILRDLVLPIPSPTTSFRFLLHFTKHYNLQTCFEGNMIHNTLHSNLLTTNEQLFIRSSSCDINVGDDMYADRILREAIMPQDETGHALSARDCIQWSPLGRRASASTEGGFSLITIAYKVQLVLRLSTPDWSTTKELRCLSFFSPDNIPIFLELYWSCWYPNWPVIHKPTFNIDTCPVPLLAAMAVMGACHGSDKNDRDNARYWFDTVEQLAFHSLQHYADHSEPHGRLQHIQAAFLACIYQTWAGEDRARIRIRRSEFRAVVNAVRDIDVSAARHKISCNFADFDWIGFARMEETIRTLIWVFCLDTAYVIFNNMPPQFALRELRMGLASCEACFQAATAWECFSILQAWSSRSSRPDRLTIYGLIRIIVGDNLNDRILDTLAHESYLNMWCVVGAFHVILFNLDAELSGKEQFSKIQTGLDNWKAVWYRRLRNRDEHFFDTVVVNESLTEHEHANLGSWKRPGFWKNAAEYWLLAQVLLERMVSAQQSAEAIEDLCGFEGAHLEVGSHVNNEVEDDSMWKLRSFLLGLVSG